MTARKNKLSIVIVNYNGKRFLKDCIKAIHENCSTLSYEIVLVDNNSQDGSQQYIKEEFSEVKFIESKENLGFSKGNNLGVKHSDGEYVLLLNNDTKLLTPLDEVILQFEEQPDFGAAGIKMLGKNEEYRLSAGYFPSPSRLVKLSMLYKYSEGFADGTMDDTRPHQVEWVEGSFLLTKRAYWDEVGGMDETLFMYGEDIDLCKKITTELRKKVVYFPTARYIHYGGYGESRYPLLINGFRKYNQRHEAIVRRKLSNLALNLNIVASCATMLLKGRMKSFRELKDRVKLIKL